MAAPRATCTDALTGNASHRLLAERFYKPSFMDALAQGGDPLEGQHANTHLPEVVGVARGWEVSGNATLAFITRHFMEVLAARYEYGATGGSNVGEYWRSPGRLGDAIAVSTSPTTHEAEDSNGFHTQESCTQYNVLKLVRHLFSWSPSAALADAYEHKLLNGVLGVQSPHAIGQMVYMTPLGKGVSRKRANWGEGESPRSL